MPDFDEEAQKERQTQDDKLVDAVKTTAAELHASQQTAEKVDRKVDLLLVKQNETRKTINRLDQRDKKAKKNARQRFSVETQELVFGYWERGQQNATLRREASKHRVKYEQVFAYYKSELKSLGVKSEIDFKTCIKLRSNRIHRITIARSLT